MTRINHVLVVILLVCCQTISFAQSDRIDTLRQLNICKDYRSIRQASFPFNDSAFNSCELVRLDASSVKAIYKASVVSLSEHEAECPSGEIDDEEVFHSDFDAENTPQAYKVIRLRLPASHKNIGAFIINTYEYMSPSYLITYRYPGQPGNCIEMINSVRLDFHMGNRHWNHHRSAVLHSESNIEIKGECWQSYTG